MITVILLCFLEGYIYEDSDSLIVNNDSLIMCGSRSYNCKVHISNNGILTIRPWDGTDSTGWLFLHAPLITIQDSSSINGSEAGYRGGSNVHPHGYGPGYGHAGSTSGGGGGGAGYGGDGGQGGDTYPGTGGSAYGDPIDTVIDMGSGGGAGRLGAVDGFGGNGGAGIQMRGQKIVLDTSSIHANGQSGYAGSIEGGGAGSGGGIILWADTVRINHSTINAHGGNGGDGSELGGGGGGGAGGRIKIFHVSTPDTAAMAWSVQGGNAGYGGYGSPQQGEPGSLYFGPVIGITELANMSRKNLRTHATIIRRGITMTLEDIPAQINMYDITGRIAKTIWIRKRTEFISLYGLEQGIYFLRTDREEETLGKIILLK